MAVFLQALNNGESKEVLDDIQRKEVDNMSEEIEKISKIPPHEYQEYSELTAKTQGIWEEAKAKNDFKMFKENALQSPSS